MKYLFLFTFYFFSTINYAGNQDLKLGKVTKEQLSEEVCPIDPEADAYYHFDIAYVQFDYDNTREGKWIAKMERKMKIKILTKEGLKAANRLIELYDYGVKGKQYLHGVKGKTYNLVNGKIKDQKLEKDNIIEEEYSDNLTNIKIAMPAVRVGSILELEYSLTTDFIFRIFDWEFQSEYPNMHSEISVLYPEFFRYTTDQSGFFPLNTSQPEHRKQSFRVKYNVNSTSPGSYGGTRTNSMRQRDYFDISSASSLVHYSGKEIPAFVPEPYLSSAENYLSGIKFQLAAVNFRGTPIESFAQTWSDIDSDLWNHKRFGGFITDKRDVSKVMEDLSISADSDADKLLQIYQSLRKKLNWNGLFSAITRDDPKDIWNNKSANSAEINLMLTALLRQSGIEAYPVALSTRNHGFINRFSPSLVYFNHVICLARIDSTSILLDLTAPTMPGTLPYHSLNLWGRLITVNGGDWVSLVPSNKFNQQNIYNLSIDPENRLVSGSAAIQLKDYAALDFRTRYHQASEGKSFLKDWAEDYGGVTSDDIHVDNLDSLHKAVTVNLKVRSEQGVTVAGDKLIFNPNMQKVFGENPFSGSERLFPIDYGFNREVSIILTIQLPEGYQMEETVKPTMVYLPEKTASFVHQVSHVGNMIQVQSKFEINKPVFDEQEFDFLKEFYSLMIQKMNEPLILTKI